MKCVRRSCVVILGCILSLLCGLSAYGEQPELSGVVFSDITHDYQVGSSAFNVQRVYVNVRGTLNPIATFRVTSDIDDPDTPGEGYTLFLKYAYLNLDLGRYSAVTGGMIGTNGFKVQENNWGMRYLFKSAMDYFDYLASADLGLEYEISFGDKISISALISNGTGYKSSENNAGKRGHLRLLYGSEDLSDETGIIMGIYGSWEQLNRNESSRIYTLFFGDHFPGVWFGGEYSNRLRDLSGLPVRAEQMFSVYTRGRFSRTFSFSSGSITPIFSP